MCLPGYCNALVAHSSRALSATPPRMRVAGAGQRDLGRGPEPAPIGREGRRDFAPREREGGPREAPAPVQAPQMQVAPRGQGVSFMVFQ